MNLTQLCRKLFSPTTFRQSRRVPVEIRNNHVPIPIEQQADPVWTLRKRDRCFVPVGERTIIPRLPNP
jgi:hypothetical protein